LLGQVMTMSEFHECVVGTFDKELQALIDYGHDCCARIDDRIHECCERIREAHKQELDNMSGAYEISMAWMKEQLSPVTYDVLGNERHKAVCKLREMPDGYPSYSAFPFAKWYEDLSTALGIGNGERSCAKVRDTLIHLLGGDAMEAKDGVDAGRCGETNAAVRVPVADKRRTDCDDNQLAEEVAPITQELRKWASIEVPYKYGHQLTAIADRIDAEHERRVAEVASGWDYWESTHVELPKDEDGEYIHIGDVMDSKVDYLFDGKPFTVRGLVLCEDGWEITDGRFGNRYKPDSLRHHREPTVEDVLREFGRGWHEQMNGPETFDIANYVERYAAKLQLRGDTE